MVFPEPKCHLVLISNFFIFSHFGQILFLKWLGQSSEIIQNEHFIFQWLRGLFCISANFCHSDHLADHQKLNIIETLAFHFLWLREIFHISINFCCLDHSVIHQKLNVIQKQIFHFLKIFSFWGEGGVHYQEQKCHVDPKPNQNSIWNWKSEGFFSLSLAN